jgi:transposase
VYAAAFARGVERAGQVVVLGDGAGWIRTLQQHHFPWAELRLDAFHVLQALDKALAAAYPQRPKQVLGELIWDGRLKEAVRRLKLIAHHVPVGAGVVHETIQYLEHQAPYIPAYARLQERGEMISSALAEEAVDRLFNARFKHQHRHWCPQSADPLLALRLLVADGGWEQYWHHNQKAA